MGNWFDGLAKRSARSTGAFAADTAVADGLTRRQVLARGAVVTGVAWTAPMLLSVRPAFAGASTCPPPGVYAVCPDMTTFLCCPADAPACVLNKKGEQVCDVEPGGECNNRGNGQCNGGFSRCDQPSNTSRFGICGGPGTICTDGSNCQFDNCAAENEPGSNTRVCGGVGSACTSTEQCAPIDANHKVANVCVVPAGSTTGTCQQP